MFELKGPVRAIHQFVNMSSEEVDYKVPGTDEAIRGKGCKPAMGHTFSSGTVDGPGLFTFETGSTVSKNPLWNLAKQLMPKSSREQIDCHAEKSILISTGEVSAPTVYVQPPSPSIRLSFAVSEAYRRIHCRPAITVDSRVVDI